MRKRSFVVACLLAALAGGCGRRHLADMGSTAGRRSDRALWDEGQRLYGKHRWQDARQQFKRLIDGYPNSELLPQARLALADTYFKESGTANDILAISEYRQYLTLYPSTDKSDYAQFQIAECYFDQRHGAERDQTQLREALAEYQKVLDLHPGSAYIEPAKARIAQVRQVLGRAEFLVGLFYQRTRQSCHSAVRRYEGVITDYADYSHLDEVLFRLSQCLVETGRKGEAAPHLHRLIQSYPQSRFLADAQSLLHQVEDPSLK